MNRNEYMKKLARRLRHLPKEDFDRAIEYFEEYFEEAGPEKEQQAIQNLGTPESAANELILNLAAETSRRETQSIKHRFSAIWIGILALFAAPIALPVALAVFITAAAIILTLVLAVFSLFLAAASVAGASVFGLAGGIALLFHSPCNGLSTIGAALFLGAAGVLAFYLLTVFSKWLLAKLAKLPGKIIRGGKRHEVQ